MQVCFTEQQWEVDKNTVTPPTAQALVWVTGHLVLFFGPQTCKMPMKN